MEQGATSAALQQQLGEPIHTGPWYNASVGVTHGGLIGNCTLSMVGSRHSADVAIRVRALACVPTSAPRGTGNQETAPLLDSTPVRKALVTRRQ